MKKRTGVERAVIVMAVVVVLLAIALIVVNVADIRIHRPAAGRKHRPRQICRSSRSATSRS
ncbi:MAG: hypothetical protein ACLUNO_11440 [Oscillospiraceae bacterium]